VEARLSLNSTAHSLWLSDDDDGPACQEIYTHNNTNTTLSLSISFFLFSLIFYFFFLKVSCVNSPGAVPTDRIEQDTTQCV
jgi:hypothetical protein